MSLISVDQDIQRPTHPRLHIRDARDAHVVLEAVRQGLLQPVKRRLNELERNMSIRSGSVFVWEESDDETGPAEVDRLPIVEPISHAGGELLAI